MLLSTHQNVGGYSSSKTPIIPLYLMTSPIQTFLLTSVGGHEICPVHHPGRGCDHGHQDRHHDQHGTLPDRAPSLGHGRVTDEYVSLDR